MTQPSASAGSYMNARDALVEFYETSFGDSSWENVEGWEDMNEELRNWYGLTLDRDGNLVRMKVHAIHKQAPVLPSSSVADSFEIIHHWSPEIQTVINHLGNITRFDRTQWRGCYRAR